ncbi:endocuticle structural glycoprotein SgAbd-4-like [Phymastichus coffea]|uniref:endocuticle structural glycoprotein SgAbd-4-like n=1 Tax=Phymastichus coffea TaxID=108790 RepID=UPI00273BFD64|nr:endocuticle structural glycoprotein SgAbd-4-like [Phymastichus coffea]
MRILLLSCLLATAYCQDELYFRQPEKIVKAQNEVGDRLGNYAFAYETEGGILQRETGQRKYEGTEDETQLIQGSVQYNAPDGTPVAISWTADEFGARVSGTHLPTPPPIPPEIQRALDWLAKQPTTEEPDYDAPTSFKPLQPKPILIKKQQFNKPLPLKRQQSF